jgi:outer membrane protein TolC
VGGLAGLFLAAPLDAQADPPPTMRSVGLVLDGPHGRLADVRARLERELVTVVGDEAVRLDPRFEVTGDWTLAGVRTAVERLFAEPDVDLVVAFGVVAAQVLAERSTFPKPTIAALVPEPGAQGFPIDPTAGPTNFKYLALELSRPPLVSFRETFSVQRVAVVVPAALAEAVPELAGRLAGASGLAAAWTIAASPDPAETAARIPAEADGVYVFPLLRWSDADVAAFASVLGARRLPSLSWSGGDEVATGLLASVTADTLLTRLPRWVGVSADVLLRGDSLPDARTSVFVREQPAFNRSALRTVAASPRWRALLDARYLGAEEPQPGPRLTMPGAMAAALDANLDLTAGARSVAAGAQQVRLASAPLWPQLGISASGRYLDGNLAEGALPFSSTGSLTGSAGLTQVLYDDRAWANRSMEKSFQSARESSYEAQRLDVMGAAAVTYLAVLAHRTLARIQRGYLGLTQSNLEIARIREATGGGRLAEVYRWQAQLAQVQAAVVRAETRTALAEQELNRLLNRPLVEPVILVQDAVDDPGILEGAARLEGFVDNPETFGAFRRFAVDEAVNTSPELRGLDAQVAAFERQRSAATRSFWLPSFSIEAGGLYRFAQWGEKQTAGDNHLWTAALVARYPLFTGLARSAESSRASFELERIELERRALRERVDQRVGSAATQVRGALVTLEVSREAADAARRNYALVEQSYREGVDAIIMLLDAQTAALTADLRAVQAAFDLLVSLSELQRALGRFDLYGPAEEREAFFTRLDTFFSASGVEVRR